MTAKCKWQGGCVWQGYKARLGCASKQRLLVLGNFFFDRDCNMPRLRREMNEIGFEFVGHAAVIGIAGSNWQGKKVKWK